MPEQPRPFRLSRVNEPSQEAPVSETVYAPSDDEKRYYATLHHLFLQALTTERARRQLDEITESRFVTSGTSLTLQPGTNLMLARSITVQCSSTATLTVKDKTYQFPVGISQLRDLSWRIQGDTTFSLTQVSAGLLSLEVCGEAIKGAV